MGRPRADLSSYSPWGAVPVPPPAAPNPLWLPILPTAGILTLGDLAVWALSQPGVNPICTLFTNEYQPVATSTLANFTPATAPGIGSQPLGAPTRMGVDPYGRANWTWPTLNYMASGGGLPVQIWGWVVSCTDPVTSAPALLWAQRLPGSFAFVAAGNTLPVVLQLSLGQC